MEFPDERKTILARSVVYASGVGLEYKQLSTSHDFRPGRAEQGVSTRSNTRRLFVYPKHTLHHIHNLAQRRVATHGIQQPRHRILGSLAGDPQPIQLLAHGAIITLLAQALQARHLAALAGRVHL